MFLLHQTGNTFSMHIKKNDKAIATANIYPPVLFIYPNPEIQAKSWLLRSCMPFILLLSCCIRPCFEVAYVTFHL